MIAFNLRAGSDPEAVAVPAALDALVQAMETKDDFLPGHSVRVAELAASIATCVGRADWEVDEIRLAGRLHDLGMIAVRDEVVYKVGSLTTEEYAEVKQHPITAGRLLAAFPGFERVARYVRGHHERWDGTGYPDRLAGEAIPWGARILAVAEIFDALTSCRSYQSATPLGEALAMMQQLSAGATDPTMMAALLHVVSQRTTLKFLRDEAPVRESELHVLEEAVGLDSGWLAS